METRPTRRLSISTVVSKPPSPVSKREKKRECLPGDNGVAAVSTSVPPSYVVPSESGPHRKYYGITAAGRAQLKQQRDDWTAFSTTVTTLLDKQSLQGVSA